MKQIDIYTSNNCQYCHEAMEFFNESNLEFTEHNISINKEAKSSIIKKGYRSVPLIIIDGQEILGFNKERIVTLLI
ncbi:MAG: glutaredoxin family protein [Clostridiaceae bacterium]|nr:glutaredoxin family protein [Clostridiaceae bacterium]